MDPMQMVLPAGSMPRGQTDPLATPQLAGDESLRAVAKRFETVFVAEMLKHAGLGEMREAFNGGAGEAGFNSLLTWEYAEEVADRGAIGLADKIYAALKERAEA